MTRSSLDHLMGATAMHVRVGWAIEVQTTDTDAHPRL